MPGTHTATCDRVVIFIVLGEGIKLNQFSPAGNFIFQRFPAFISYFPVIVKMLIYLVPLKIFSKLCSE